MEQIRANSVLPAERKPISLLTTDGLRLVGELAVPAGRPPRATIVCVHPLPTAGGMMDSHLFRKAAWRLPALADIAVLRFNTRGTHSPAGTSEGEFSDAVAEGLDLAAAVERVSQEGLPLPWLVGWSFGTDVILKHPEVRPVAGAVLLSPPARYSSEAELVEWGRAGLPTTALIPELDDYLRPAEAVKRFAVASNVALIPVDGAGHLWVGEANVRIVLNEIVRVVAPDALNPETGSLPTQWEGPMERWNDL
ncbi:MAG: alpha/beta hydrolase [Candidatus Nanopelagicales bacterium]